MTARAKDKTEVIERLCAAGETLRSFGVTEVGLFGSFVTGRQSSASDIDLLVDFAPDQHTFDNFMDLSFFLEDLLGRRVELVTRTALSPHIGPHILSEVERVPVSA